MLPQADFDKANELLVDMDWEQLLDIPDLNQALKNWEGPCMTSWITVSQSALYQDVITSLGYQRASKH